MQPLFYDRDRAGENLWLPVAISPPPSLANYPGSFLMTDNIKVPCVSSQRECRACVKNEKDGDPAVAAAGDVVGSEKRKVEATGTKVS